VEQISPKNDSHNRGYNLFYVSDYFFVFFFFKEIYNRLKSEYFAAWRNNVANIYHRV